MATEGTTEIVKKNTEGVAKAMTAAPEYKPTNSLKSMLSSATVKARFDEVLKSKAPGFISSVLSAVATNKALQTCEPGTVLQAAAIAASLDLSVNSSLGECHIVPYNNQAQFQVGWRGLVQLALRTGQYEKMNSVEVYEGELVSYNRAEGVIDLSGTKTSEVVVGYYAYFKLINGFKAMIYMSMAEMIAHGKKYSKSFGRDNSPWKAEFHAMGRKTVIKKLLKDWGPKSIEMSHAIVKDQSVSRLDDGAVTYPDGKDADIEVDTVPEPAS